MNRRKCYVGNEKSYLQPLVKVCEVSRILGFKLVRCGGGGSERVKKIANEREVKFLRERIETVYVASDFYHSRGATC